MVIEKEQLDSIINLKDQILMQSSEISAKAVKKYTSVLLIICILWGFIGYAFTQRYVQADLLTSVIGAAVVIIIVIQIERLVILSMGQNRWGKWAYNNWLYYGMYWFSYH